MAKVKWQKLKKNSKEYRTPKQQTPNNEQQTPNKE
jgi:hypothetical protein